MTLAFFVSSASSASATLLNGHGFFEFTPSGTIIVEKQTVPDGDPTNFDFTGSPEADGMVTEFLEKPEDPPWKYVVLSGIVLTLGSGYLAWRSQRGVL